VSLLAEEPSLERNGHSHINGNGHANGNGHTNGNGKSHGSVVVGAVSECTPVAA